MQSSDDLIGLSYCSTATFPARSGNYGVHPEVNRILVHSRRNNRRLRVGGVLHYSNGMFFQYLEGPADVVDGLYARICRDARHRDVQRLTRRPIRSRRFRDWSMKFVVAERVVTQVMQRHGLEGFDPYRFTPAIIDDLVVSCTCVPDDAKDIKIEPKPTRMLGLGALLKSDNLIGLSYCSTATFPARSGNYGVHPEVNRILVHSRRNNRRLQVGGVLHFANGLFFQYLEGPADVVDCLYARICRDARHRDVQRLTRRPIRSRRFRDWSMKFVAVERVVTQVMQRHGLEDFDPYRFTPAIIDDLVVSCTCVPDDAEGIGIERRPTRTLSLRALLTRLFG